MVIDFTKFLDKDGLKKGVEYIVMGVVIWVLAGKIYEAYMDERKQKYFWQAKAESCQDSKERWMQQQILKDQRQEAEQTQALKESTEVIRQFNIRK